MHSRQSHSEKVALVSREIAEHLCRIACVDEDVYDAIASFGGLDIAACEVAGLAHDFGHPPFGHTAEVALDYELKHPTEVASLFEGEPVLDGFEGNAQSFRILLRLDGKKPEEVGLGLSHVTMGAMQKYPSARRGIESGDLSQHSASDFADRGDKFGAYHNPPDSKGASDEDVRSKVNKRLLPGGAGHGKSLEAAVMDLADDMAYAVHDFEDFLAEGVLNGAQLRYDLDAAVIAILRSADELNLCTVRDTSDVGINPPAPSSDEPEDETNGDEFDNVLRSGTSEVNPALVLERALSVEWKEGSPEDWNRFVDELCNTGQYEDTEPNLLLVHLDAIFREGVSQSEVEDAFDALYFVREVLGNLGLSYSKSELDSRRLRATMSTFVRAMFSAVRVRGLESSQEKPQSSPAYLVGMPKYLMRWLKLFAREYIVATPLVGLSERAQVRSIQLVYRGLESWVYDNAVRGGGSLPEPLESMLPSGEHRVVRRRRPELDLLTWESRRAIADYMCSLSDHQCLSLASYLQGVSAPRVGSTI